MWKVRLDREERIKSWKARSFKGSSLLSYLQMVRRYGRAFSSFGWGYPYYRLVYLRKILNSKSIVCDKHGGFELHILTRNVDLLDCIWSLKTFYHYSGLRPRLVVHGNGTLNQNCVRIFSKHFVNSLIIRKKKADSDLKEFLRGYPYSEECRFDAFYPHSLKLFDPFYYSDSENILMLDSDVLFFQTPIELLANLSNNKGFFMNDCSTCYSIPIDELASLMGIEIRPRINTGVLFFPKKYYNLDVIETCLEGIYSRKREYPNLWGEEQTAFAVLCSKYRDSFIRLSGSYQIFKEPVTSKTVCHHFTMPIRETMCSIGLKRLKLTNFLMKYRDQNKRG